MSNSYLKALEAARLELSQLVTQRIELDERIRRLNASVESLAALCDGADHSQGLPMPDSDSADLGSMSNSIREIIKSNVTPMKAPEIRDQLVAEGFDPNKYANMLTVIHNTLNRLERQGEITKIRLLGDFWGWTRAPKSAEAIRHVGPATKELMSRKAADVTGPGTAHGSGMRGDEKPKK